MTVLFTDSSDYFYLVLNFDQVDSFFKLCIVNADFFKLPPLVIGWLPLFLFKKTIFDIVTILVGD